MKSLIKKLLREELSNTDCGNLFTDSSDGSLHSSAIENDLYYYVLKQKKVTLEYMSPDDYFNEIGGLDRHKQSIDWPNVAEKVEEMKNGIKLNIPYLIYSYGSNSGHEGRHRVLAAKEMGCTSLPVMVEKSVSQNDVMNLANELGDLETDEMAEELKKRGFNHFKNIDRVASVLRMSKKYGKITIL